MTTATLEETFVCADCGIEKPIKTEGGTGYGYDPSTYDKICYGCCAERDKRTMDREDRMTLYLTMRWSESAGRYYPDKVTNWPGTLEFNVHTWDLGKHNFAGRRYDVWFRDHKGREWHGTQYGDNTQLCHCRKLRR